MTMTAVRNEAQVVFAFDATSSMKGVLEDVKKEVTDLIQRLDRDFPVPILTAVVAIGDYSWNPAADYVVRHAGFTGDTDSLVRFIDRRATVVTDGAADGEAYEVMLRLVRRDLRWNPGSRRVLVVIGDEFPHRVSDPVNKEEIDWKRETRLLDHMGVRICGLQAGYCPSDYEKSVKFFRMISEATGGQFLTMADISRLHDVITELCVTEEDETRDGPGAKPSPRKPRKAKDSASIYKSAAADSSQMFPFPRTNATTKPRRKAEKFTNPKSEMITSPKTSKSLKIEYKKVTKAVQHKRSARDKTIKSVLLKRYLPERSCKASSLKRSLREKTSRALPFKRSLTEKTSRDRSLQRSLPEKTSRAASLKRSLRDASNKTSSLKRSLRQESSRDVPLKGSL